MLYKTFAMTPKPEFDLLFLLRILEAAEKIKLYAEPFSDPLIFFEANDQKEFNACLNLLAQPGELANKISSQSKELDPSFEWEKLYGLRNRVVHDYTGIDKFSTFEIIKVSVPKTIHSLSNIIRKGLLQNQFSQADLDLAKTSPYLKHVNFAEI